MADQNAAQGESRTKAPTWAARSERELRGRYYRVNRHAMGRLAAWWLAFKVARRDWSRYGA